MPQISLYVDKETLSAIEDAAKRDHLSLSKWVVKSLRRDILQTYPSDFLSLFGSVGDDTFVRPKESDGTADHRRERF